MVDAVLFSSRSEEWETPQELFDVLDNEFHFNLDPCATFQNAKCERFFTKEDNGLMRDWQGIVFCNPPYGKEIALWVQKAALAAQAGATVVLLIHARTDTRWFHEWVLPFANEIRFIKGRLNFSKKGPSTFPSLIVVFRSTPSELKVPRQGGC